MADKVKMPHIALIAARSTPGHVIGRDNRLPWRLKSDLRRFKALTSGHAILMGRKTFESIGRPLPDRTTIVVSGRRARPVGDPADAAGVLWAGSLDDALFLADLVSIGRGRNEVFVAGGGEIYDLVLARDLADRVYLTEVEADVSGDAFFRHDFAQGDWRVGEITELPAGGEDEYASRFVTYRHSPDRDRRRAMTSFAAEAGSWRGRYMRDHAGMFEGFAAAHRA